MGGRFRVLDTGVQEGRFNIALDQAMIEARQSGLIPDTFRFIRFPPTALIGRHQALSQEIDLDYCRAQGVGIVRRITGGGAIYLDEGQLGWGLVFDRSTLGLASLADVASEICEAVAAGLGQLGVEARYRPRNDIEVNGRKISGTGGFFDGDTLIYQGTVLVDMRPADMVAALRVPRAKLAKRDLDSAEQRVVTLRELLGEEAPTLVDIQHALLDAFAKRFGIDWVAGELTEDEKRLARQRFDEEIGQDDFVAEIDDPAGAGDLAMGAQTGPGGTVTTYLRLDGPQGGRVSQILITGDFFVAPPRTVYDLEGAIRGCPTDDVPAEVERFFQERSVSALSVTPEDFLASIRSALAQARARRAAPE